MIHSVLKAAVESKPAQKLLVRLHESKAGKRFLNRVTFPRGVFDTFEEAVAAAAKTAKPGHENPGNAVTHWNLASALLISDYPVLYWMNQAGNDLKVLDYGGNVGNLYHAYRNHLRAKKLEWTVSDLPMMIEAGRTIAKEKSTTSELRFRVSSDPFPDVNFALLCGSYHYWEGTASDFVARFPAPPKHILINRSPMVDGEVKEHATVQFSQYCALPCIIRNKRDIAAAFELAGYRLVDSWLCPEYSVKKSLFPRQSLDHCSGLYFQRKDG